MRLAHSMLVLVLCLGFAAPLRAAEGDLPRGENTVLVLELRPQGVNADAARAVTAQIAELVAARSDLRVMTVGELNELVDLQRDLRKLDCDSDACIAEMSKAANAQLALSGSIGKVGAEFLLSVSLVDVEKQASAGSAARSVRALEDVGAVLPELLAEVFGWEGVQRAKVRYRLPEGNEISFAVFDLDALGISEAAAANLTQMLAVEIKKIEGTQVVSRDDIASMLQLEANKIAMDCEDEMACLAEIGGALGVEMLVVGHAGKLGESYIVSLRMIRVRESLVVSRVTETFRGLEDQLLPAVRQAGRRLLGIEATEPGALALAGSQQEAIVRVDNKEVGTLPMPAVSGLTPGKHRVNIIKDGFFPWYSDVYIEPGGTTPLWAAIEEEPEKWYEKWWVWTIAGGVVAGGVVGLAIGLQPQDPPGVADIELQ